MGTGAAERPVERTWLVIALVMAAVNIFGGFLVTRRMLAMFQKS